MTPPQCQCCSLFVALLFLHIFTTRWTTAYQTGWHLCCCIVSDHTTGGPTSTSLTYPVTLNLSSYCACWLGCLYNPLLTRKGLYDCWVASDSAAAIVTFYSLLVLSSRICHHCSIATKLSPSPVGSMSLFKLYCLISSTLVSLPKSRYLTSWTEKLNKLL